MISCISSRFIFLFPSKEESGREGEGAGSLEECGWKEEEEEEEEEEEREEEREEGGLGA